MLTLIPPTPVDLQSHLGESGQQEYQQIVSLLEDDLESFALCIVRSDFDTSTRDALLNQLATDITPIPFKTVSLSYDHFNVLDSLTQINTEFTGPAVIAVVGLEETPQIFASVEEMPQRPPALAILNHGREVIRQGKHPVIFWCDPTSYAALREHAPDFFDHYTGLFTFLDAAPHPVDTIPSPPPILNSRITPDGRPRLLSVFSQRRVSPTAKRFYEEQVERLATPTPERARALMGLVDTLFALPDESFRLHIDRAENFLREALAIYEQQEIQVEAARCHAMLASLINLKMRCLGFDSSEFRSEMNYHAEASLEIFSEQEYPVEWAAMQWFLAALGEDKPRDEIALRRAIPHLQSALRIFTKQFQPYFWGSIHMNLGQIYSELPYSSSNSKRAISHLEQALEAYNESDYPHEFALVQMILGKAYQKASKHKKNINDHAKLIRRAISCYEAAARNFSRNREPEKVALAYVLMGMAWQQVPTGNKREHLRRSADFVLKAANLLGQCDEAAMQASHYSLAGDVLLKLAQLTRRSNEIVEARDAFEAAQRAHERADQFGEATQSAQTVQGLNNFLRNALEN